MADMSGPTRERVRAALPAAPMIGALEALRCLADNRGMSPTQRETINSPGLVQWSQGERDAEGALLLPPIDVLEGHDTAGLNPRRLQGKLGKMVNAATSTSFRDAPGNLLEAYRPPEADDPFGGIETSDFALPHHRSMTGGGALECLRVQPFDCTRTIPANIFVRVATILRHRTIHYTRAPLWGEGHRHALRAYILKVGFPRYSGPTAGTRDGETSEATGSKAHGGERRAVHR